MSNQRLSRASDPNSGAVHRSSKWRRAGGRIAGLALLAVVATLLGQCGGSGGTDSSTTTETPPVALVADKTVGITNGVFEPKHLDVSRGQKHKVQWNNADEFGYSLEFNKEGWPFQDPPHVILVPGNGKSEVLTIWSGVPKGPYGYEVRKAGLFTPTPTTTTATGPPDPPQVNVGD